MLLDVDMDGRDHALINRILKENQDNVVRRKLIGKYNKYYQHWIDYNILCSFLSMIGLILGIIEWENNYSKRGDIGVLLEQSIYSELIILSITLLGDVAIILKYRMEATWRHHKNPIKFYRKMMRQQVDIGVLDEGVMKNKTIARENPYCWMFKNWSFWAEIVIMSIIPLPTNSPESFFGL